MAVSVILFLTAVLCSLCHADTETVVVKTSLGSVKGYTDQTIHGRRLNGFKGLPYAKPPIGELRFKVTFSFKYIKKLFYQINLKHTV